MDRPASQLSIKIRMCEWKDHRNCEGRQDTAIHRCEWKDLYSNISQVDSNCNLIRKIQSQCWPNPSIAPRKLPNQYPHKVQLSTLNRDESTVWLHTALSYGIAEGVVAAVHCLHTGSCRIISVVIGSANGNTEVR